MTSSGVSAPGLVLSLAVGFVSVSCAPASDGRSTAAYVGRESCAGCHPTETTRWTGSNHDLAMGVATDPAVLGDFDDAIFESGGDTTTFFRRDGRFLVRTAGPDGEVREYEVEYTFGVEPLQQYLIAFPGGRYQPLGIAWDGRPESDGGQRWFHLYPDAPPAPGDPLHWTGRDQTWNYQCAECHSTNLEKNYDPATDAYQTTWSEIDVSCEACHGPGSEHVRWAEAAEPGATLDPNSGEGAILRLGEPDGATWQFEPGETIARRSAPLSTVAQVETCARCHSRRGVLLDEYTHGAPILETHRVSLLEEGLYYADGQILDEVYVYGSFLQSRMHRVGVTCTDCHDAHTAELRAEGNALCAQCHMPSAYDTPDHHLHPADSPGAACVECHMPARTYMVVDSRRDHGFRIPRPGLAAEIGAPDACTGCHTDQTPQWAASILARRFGVDPVGARYARVLHAGRQGDPRAAGDLAALAADTAEAEIVRATAALLLGRIPSPETDRAIRAALRDPRPLVRLGALRALEGPRVEAHWRVAYDLLNDPIRAVRLEAARRLAGVPREALTREQAEAVDRGVEAYLASELVNAERPEAYLNIGAVYVERGALIEVRAAFETALERDPTFIPAYVNLADLFRATGVDSEAEASLRRGLEVAPDDASLLHSLGLTLVRKRQMTEALDALRRAAELTPGSARYGYVYGIALHSTGDGEGAIAALERAIENSPFDPDLLVGLATISRDLGRLDAAIEYAEELVELWPVDATAQQLLRELMAADRP